MPGLSFLERSMWREKWQAAYEEAEFYHSKQNTVSYWDRVAGTGESGLAGNEHILKLLGILLKERILSADSEVIDIGCGCGDYTLEFAKHCRYVTANDSSPEMLATCKKKAEKAMITNLIFEKKDYREYDSLKKYDLVIAALNPSTYSSEGFEQLMKLSKWYVVYMSMDIPLEGAKDEPVYRGCNSVRFAEEYLKEASIAYEKVPYVYRMKTKDGTVREIPFAYLICRMKTSSHFSNDER